MASWGLHEIENLLLPNNVALWKYGGCFCDEFSTTMFVKVTLNLILLLPSLLRSGFWIDGFSSVWLAFCFQDIVHSDPLMRMRRTLVTFRAKVCRVGVRR